MSESCLTVPPRKSFWPGLMSSRPCWRDSEPRLSRSYRRQRHSNGQDTGDDFAEHLLIDPCAAQNRFQIPQDTLRKWARETTGTEQAIGTRRGGRWVLSIPRLRKRCGLE
jgi:hypothetical protein